MCVWILIKGVRCDDDDDKDDNDEYYTAVVVVLFVMPDASALRTVLLFSGVSKDFVVAKAAAFVVSPPARTGNRVERCSD